MKNLGIANVGYTGSMAFHSSGIIGMGLTPKLTFAILMLALFAASVRADINITNHFSGFASVAVVTNDNPDLMFRRDVTQGEGSYDGDLDWLNDSSLGLQLQTEWSYHFQTTFQVVLKDRFNNSPEESLEWGFLRYRPIEGLDIRLGRLGTDIFMLADYRQVGYTYHWVRPPHDTYGLLSYYSLDGIDINKRISLGDSALNIKVFYGRSDQEYPYGPNDADSVRLQFDGAGISFNWEQDNWKVRYSYATIEVGNNNKTPLLDALLAVGPIWPDALAVAEGMFTKGKKFKYNELGVIYDNNTWAIQAEAVKLDGESTVIQSSRHAYLSIGRRINEFTIYALRGYVRSSNPPISLTVPPGYPAPLAQQLSALAYGAELAVNGSRSHQHNIGVGVRWDFTSKMALKFQAEQFKMDKYGSAIWIKVDPLSPPKNQTANVLSMSLDILF